MAKMTVACLAVMAVFISCKKDDKDDNNGNNPGGNGNNDSFWDSKVDVYVVGHTYAPETGEACLWKNGAKQKLGEGYEALSVCVSDTNVYVAGNNIANGNVPYIWKNGIKQELNGGSGKYAKSIYVSGNDVYVAGYKFNGSVKERAILWENGVQKILPAWDYDDDTPMNAYANSVFVYNNDVYVAGQSNIGGICIWKNGIKQALLSSGTDMVSYANSIFVYNGDVYVAGYIWGEQGYEIDQAYLWKNGERVLLGDNSSANSVFVYNDNVYVTGYSNGQACLWKNGVKEILKDGNVGNSVFVYNGDVYVTGTGYESGRNKAILWKNGTPKVLEEGANINASANSVFVKVK